METYSKIPALNEAINHALVDVQRSLNKGGSLPPIVVLMQLNDDQTEPIKADVIDVSQFHESVLGKIALASTMDEALTRDDSPINALMYFSEAWALTGTNRDELPDNFEDSPDREEVAIIVARTRTSTETFMFTLDRETKTFARREDEGKYSGRMVGTPVKAK